VSYQENKSDSEWINDDVIKFNWCIQCGDWQIACRSK